MKIYGSVEILFHVRWVPVTTSWCGLGLRMEQPPAMEGNCEYMNNQPRTNDKVWSSSCGVGHGLTTTIKNKFLTKQLYRALDLD
jgi:hypothetical protein